QDLLDQLVSGHALTREGQPQLLGALGEGAVDRDVISGRVVVVDDPDGARIPRAAAAAAAQGQHSGRGGGAEGTTGQRGSSSRGTVRARIGQGQRMGQGERTGAARPRGGRHRRPSSSVSSTRDRYVSIVGGLNGVGGGWGWSGGGGPAGRGRCGRCALPPAFLMRIVRPRRGATGGWRGNRRVRERSHGPLLLVILCQLRFSVRMHSRDSSRPVRGAERAR